jgi:hypothetical protein
MAGRADRVPQVDDGILVAVRKDLVHLDEMARRLALAPALLAAAAVESGEPAGWWWE